MSDIVRYLPAYVCCERAFREPWNSDARPDLVTIVLIDAGGHDKAARNEARCPLMLIRGSKGREDQNVKQG